MPAAFRRVRHVLSENERTLQAARAIRSADWAAMGRLMYASHASLRDDYEVSCPELDAIVEIAQGIPLEEGMYGCRMTGAGFGGCAVSLVRTDAVRPLIARLGQGYEARTENHATIFSTRPASGARMLKGG